MHSSLLLSRGFLFHDTLITSDYQSLEHAANLKKSLLMKIMKIIHQMAKLYSQKIAVDSSQFQDIILERTLLSKIQSQLLIDLLLGQLLATLLFLRILIFIYHQVHLVQQTLRISLIHPIIGAWWIVASHHLMFSLFFSLRQLCP